MTEIRGVLFDVDGTLVDSNYLHTVAWWQAFRRLDYDIPMAAIHRAIGMGGDKLIGHLLDGDPDPEIEETLDSTHAAVISTFWPSLRAFDGAADLLRATASRGLAVVLASSASAADLDALRAAIDADDAITKATSSSDAAESKPAPDILQAALDSADLRAEDTVFVGDSIWDIKSAAKLGIPTVALTCGGTSEAELREAGARQVFASPRELLEHLDDSLLGQLDARTKGPAMTTDPTTPAHDAANIREEQGTHAPGTVPPGDFGDADKALADGQDREDAFTEPEGADD